MMMAWIMGVAVEVVESSCTPDSNIWNTWKKESSAFAKRLDVEWERQTGVRNNSKGSITAT